MAQMNPLIGPKLSNTTILVMAREWVNIVLCIILILMLTFFIMYIFITEQQGFCHRRRSIRKDIYYKYVKSYL